MSLKVLITCTQVDLILRRQEFELELELFPLNLIVLGTVTTAENGRPQEC